MRKFLWQRGLAVLGDYGYGNRISILRDTSTALKNSPAGYRVYLGMALGGCVRALQNGHMG